MTSTAPAEVAAGAGVDPIAEDDRATEREAVVTHAAADRDQQRRARLRSDPYSYTPMALCECRFSIRGANSVNGRRAQPRERVQSRLDMATALDHRPMG